MELGRSSKTPIGPQQDKVTNKVHTWLQAPFVANGKVREVFLESQHKQKHPRETTHQPASEP